MSFGKSEEDYDNWMIGIMHEQAQRTQSSSGNWSSYGKSEEDDYDDWMNGIRRNPMNTAPHRPSAKRNHREGPYQPIKK